MRWDRRKHAPSIASFSSKDLLPIPHKGGLPQGQGRDPGPGPGAQDATPDPCLPHRTAGPLTTDPRDSGLACRLLPGPALKTRHRARKERHQAPSSPSLKRSKCFRTGYQPRSQDKLAIHSLGPHPPTTSADTHCQQGKVRPPPATGSHCAVRTAGYYAAGTPKRPPPGARPRLSHDNNVQPQKQVTEPNKLHLRKIYKNGQN